VSAITETTHEIATEIAAARHRAHDKHGANSIEALDADAPGWLAILAEEGGEVAEVMVDLFAHTILDKALGRVAHSGTYDAEKGSLRAELVDVASVAVAWIAAIDRREVES
jgi:hypothetical protein